ncbi:MAG: DNA polymerase III subunit gamma/tau [Bacteroidota bacterium]
MSQFIVSARKYRPARFDEVVGQQHVSQTLKNALQNDHLAHAFLFCGPRGVGKTTCARILAKVLNCQNVTDDFEACNECDSCKAFNENASFNITELDAASNNSVEHIRALIEQVRFQPQQGKYKVFIIDEVHMLSQQAFNAFLKTLEEPPPYAIFILATTEKHKIIPTILSRCQIFDFRRIQVQAMVEHLQSICIQENIEADKDALHIVAQKADGALRDALSIFDRIVSFSGQKIIYQDVIENLNVLDYDYFFKIVDALLTENLPAILLTFDDIQRKGFEADIFINGLAAHLRNLLVCKDEQTLQLLEVSDGLRQRYQQQASVASASFLITVLNIANDCDVNYKMARNKRLHVEMALVKMVYINRAVNLGPIAASQQPIQQPIDTAEKKTLELSTSPSVPPTAPAPTPPVQKSNPAPTAPPAATPPPTVESMPPGKPAAAPAKSNGRLGLSSKHSVGGINMNDLYNEVQHENDSAKNQVEKTLDLQVVQSIWNEFIQKVESPSVRNTLKNTELKVDAGKIIAMVGSAMNKEMIQQERQLMDFLREKLEHRLLVMEIKIDNSRLPEVPKKKLTMLTPKEKFQMMKEKNPHVEQLRQLFDLKPDNS